MTHTKNPNDIHAKRWSNVVGYGCASLIVLAMLMCGGAVVWVSQATRTMLINTGRIGVTSDLQATQLPQETQDEILKRIDHVIAKYDAGQIGHAQMVHLFDRLATCHTLAAAQLYAVESHHVPASGLTPHEQVNAIKQARRLALGLTAETIPPHLFKRAMNPITAQTRDDGRPRLLETINDATLKTWIAQAEQCADEAGITNENISLDYVALFEDSLVQIMNENPGETATMRK